jgi:hypothetical protein
MIESLPMGEIRMPKILFAASSTTFVNNYAIEAAALVKGVNRVGSYSPDS